MPSPLPERRDALNQHLMNTLAEENKFDLRLLVQSQLLSRRQMEVLTLLVDGRTDNEIAATLRISPRTARAHADRLREKFGASRRANILPRLLAVWCRLQREI